MTTGALGRQPLPVEWADRPYLMAGIAIHHRVRTDERKTILVLANVVDRHLPAGIAVAKIALSPIFAAMNVRMTILALFAGVSEDQILVAVAAAYLGMQAAQCEPCLAMIEFRNHPDGYPPLGGVTVLAGNVQFPVRAVGLVFCAALTIIARV